MILQIFSLSNGKLKTQLASIDEFTFGSRGPDPAQLQVRIRREDRWFMVIIDPRVETWEISK